MPAKSKAQQKAAGAALAAKRGETPVSELKGAARGMYDSMTIQELEEFEIAPYPDLAEYVRMFLPNQTFVKTHQTKLTQVFNFNFRKPQELAN